MDVGLRDVLTTGGAGGGTNLDRNKISTLKIVSMYYLLLESQLSLVQRYHCLGVLN